MTKKMHIFEVIFKPCGMVEMSPISIFEAFLIAKICVLLRDFNGRPISFQARFGFVLKSDNVNSRNRPSKPAATIVDEPASGRRRTLIFCFSFDLVLEIRIETVAFVLDGIIVNP